MRRWALTSAIVYLSASVAIAAWLLPTGRELSPSPFASPRPHTTWPLTAENAEDERTAALRQARVWMPATPASVDLSANPPDPGGTLSDPIVRCRYLDGPARGTTAKFD